MYKFMNLWRIRGVYKSWDSFYRGYPIEKFIKPDTAELIIESFANYIIILARQVYKLLPIGHRWRGDVGIESEVSNG